MLNLDALAFTLTGLRRYPDETDESFKRRVKYRLVDPSLPCIPLTEEEGRPFGVQPVCGPQE